MTQVWIERDGVDPPTRLAPLPASWPARYERAAADHGLRTTEFPAAVALVGRLWAEMFPNQET